MHKERDRVSDIIRQEFADRLVFTDEENKRIKNQISELKARQRIELDKSKEEIEEIKRQKDEEMEEVHKRYNIKFYIGKNAKIRNRYNQVPHLTQDTIWERDKYTRKHHIQGSQEVSLSQQVTTRLHDTDRTI